MQIIKNLSDIIKSEISDANKYAHLALQKKHEDRALAEMFYALSEDNLQHVNIIHQQVVRLINEYKSRKGEPPEGMLAIYEYIHEEQIDAVAEVRRLLDMYKK